MKKNNYIYDPFEAMTFDDNRCFLCGCEFDGTTHIRSAEHVFPKWLQHKCNLWNQEINLLNKTGLKYRQLTIPCCKKCNNEYLQELENEISQAVENGYEAFKKIDEFRIFQWASKIYYGILYKELFLPLDRSVPHEGNIIDDDLLKNYKMHHVFLQSVRLPFLFQGYKPWSIFIYKTIDYKDERCFTFADSLHLTLSIRFGEIGLIVVFQDNGIIKETFGEMLAKFEKITLADIQFDEICAIVQYKKFLLNRTPLYITQKNTPIVNVTCMPMGGLSTKDIFDNWDMSAFGHVLEGFWSKYDLTYEQIMPVPDNHITYLRDETGKYLKQYGFDNKFEKLIPINS